jgi:hypothetical protein
MEDAYWDEGIWWLNILENTKMYLKFTQWWGLSEEKAWSLFWEKFTSDVKRTKNKDTLKYMLTQVFAWFISNHWLRNFGLEAYNNDASDIWKKLNLWWINIYNDLRNFSPQGILWWEANSIISRIANNILAWNSFKWSSFFDINVKESIDETKKFTDDVF